MAFKVFISYATKDLPIVNYFAQLLRNTSIEVYIAEYSALPGVTLDERQEAKVKFYLSKYLLNERRTQQVIGCEGAHSDFLFTFLF